MADMLNDPADDEVALATAIVRKINDMRAAEKQWAVPMVEAGKLVAVFGPYPTPDSAMADVGKGILPTRPDARVSLHRMIDGPESQDRWERGDEWECTCSTTGEKSQ